MYAIVEELYYVRAILQPRSELEFPQATLEQKIREAIVGDNSTWKEIFEVITRECYYVNEIFEQLVATKSEGTALNLIRRADIDSTFGKTNNKHEVGSEVEAKTSSTHDISAGRTELCE